MFSVIQGYNKMRCILSQKISKIELLTFTFDILCICHILTQLNCRCRLMLFFVNLFLTMWSKHLILCVQKTCQLGHCQVTISINT